MKTKKTFRPSGMLFRRLCLWPAVACVLLTAWTCAATNRTWSGAASPDDNWMTRSNWVGNVAPLPGDNLIFPSVFMGGNLTNHNNYPAGTMFGNISIGSDREQDYAIGGNRVVLTNGLSGGSSVFGSGGAYVYFDITISNNTSISFSFTSPGGLVFNNTIDASSYFTLIINNSGSVVINGTLTNSVYQQFDLYKTNNGTLTISSSAKIPPPESLYVYQTGGTVAMESTAPNAGVLLEQGSLIVDGTIGDVTLYSPGVSISGTGNIGEVVVDYPAGTGTFTPGDNGAPGILQSDFFAPTDGADGPSALQILINGTQPGSGYGQLLMISNYSLGSSPTNQMELPLQWNYTPQVGDSFQVVKQATPEPYLIASNFYFAGLPPDSIDDATNGASLGVAYTSNGVTLTTLRTASSPFVLWKGSVSAENYESRNWSVTNNWAQNVGPVSGDVLLFSQYQTAYYFYTLTLPVPPITNDLPSGTSLAGLVFTGSNYMVYGNPITVTGGITNNTAGGTNFFGLTVTASGTLQLDVEPGGSFLMDGAFAGSGTVSKLGGGLLIYAGDTADTFVGGVSVSNGTLEVDGSFIDGSFTVNGGTLDGNGTVSAVTVNSGGTLKPGDSPGVLHVEGKLTMASGAVFTAELDNPTPGSGYDQLQVSGGVSLNGATLNLQPNFAVSVGTTFFILVNDGTGAIAGTFAGLPEGAVFQTGGQYFSISYQAGFGNKNVLVTRVNPPGNLTGIRSVPPTAVELFGEGGTNATYTILANTNLATTNWVAIGTASANGSGSFFFYDSNVVLYPQRFYSIQPP